MKTSEKDAILKGKCYEGSRMSIITTRMMMIDEKVKGANKTLKLKHRQCGCNHHPMFYINKKSITSPSSYVMQESNFLIFQEAGASVTRGVQEGWQQFGGKADRWWLSQGDDSCDILCWCCWWLYRWGFWWFLRCCKTTDWQPPRRRSTWWWTLQTRTKTGEEDPI